MATAQIVNVVRTALVHFVGTLEVKYEIKVPDRAWIGGCQTILKSGARAGQLCGKTLRAGSGACSSHSKATAETPLPKPSAVKELAYFRKSKYGRYVCENLVLDKATKGVCGREEEDGTVNPLTAEDRKRCVALRLQIVELKNVPASEPEHNVSTELPSGTVPGAVPGADPLDDVPDDGEELHL